MVAAGGHFPGSVFRRTAPDDPHIPGRWSSHRILRTVLRVLLAVGSVAAVLYGMFEMFDANLGVGFMGGPSTRADYTADIAEYHRGVAVSLIAAATGTALAVWARRRVLLALEIFLLVAAAAAAVLWHVSPEIPPT